MSPSLSGLSLSREKLADSSQVPTNHWTGTFVFKRSVTTHLFPEISTCILHTMFSLEAAIYGLALPPSPQRANGGLLPVVIATEFHSSKVNDLENKTITVA